MRSILRIAVFTIPFLFFSIQSVEAQHIKVDNGILFSSFHNEKDLPIISSEQFVSYSFLLGADYLEKDWFYLSSQIGFMKLGGKETNDLPQEENNYVSESGDYIHFNTTFRAYKNISGANTFAGVGPYINILASEESFEAPLYQEYDFTSQNVGGKTEIGLTYDINKFRLGILGTYLFGLSPLAKSEHLSLYNNAFSGMLTIGYRIKNSTY